MGEEYLTRFVVKPGEDITPLAFPKDVVTLILSFLLLCHA
jgi:hypothetical protein